MSREIKEDAFLSMLFDSLLEESELTDEDTDEIDYKVKKGIVESLGMKIVVDTNVIIISAWLENGRCLTYWR